MLRKIYTIDDLKAELTRYFETMRAIPAPKRPGFAKNYLWQLMKTEQTAEDVDNDSEKFIPTQVDIADCWYIDANFMPHLTRFEYELLSARLRDKPLPWKVIERQHHKSRQMLDIYINKALGRLLEAVKI